MVVVIMTLREKLLHLANLYTAATKGRGPDRAASLSSLSTRLFNDGKTLRRISEGGDIATGNFERAVRWLSDNWPDGVDWPEGIARPATTPATGEAA